MKKLLPLFALQLLSSFFIYAGIIDNKKIKINNSDVNNYRIVPSLDNGYLLFSRDMSTPIISHLDAQGQLQWAKTFSYPNLFSLYDAGVFPDSSIYVIYIRAGSTGANCNYLAIKLNTQGVIQWATNIFFTGNHMAYVNSSVAKSQSDGSLVFAPSLGTRIAAIKLDSNGAVAFSKIFVKTTNSYLKDPGMDAVPADNKGMVVLGKDQSYPVIARIDSNGTTGWMTYFSTGSGNYDRPYSIIRTSDGNYLIGGLHSNSSSTAFQAWMMKLNSSGSILWGKRYSGSASGQPFSGLLQLMENPDGSITASGYIGDPFDPSDYAAVVTFDSSGQPLSAYSYPLATPFRDIHSRIYKASDGLLKISTGEQNLSGGFGSILINPSGLSSYCKASSFSLTTTNIPAVTYRSNNAYTTETLPVPTHPTITMRDTAITITNKELCSFTAVKEVSIANSFKLFPNPVCSSGEVALQWNSIELPVEQILLYDVSGRLVKQLNSSSTGSISFSLSDMLPGMYFVHAMSKEQKTLSIEKLLVAH